MPSIALIFKDTEGNEQMRVCYVETSGPIRLIDGNVKAAGSVGVGDVVCLPDGSFRAVDDVEES